jgi:hypothetical protein
VFGVLEKLVVVFKLFEGVTTMFGFFKTIKSDLAALKARFEALEAKVESFFAPKAVSTADTAPVRTSETAANTPMTNGTPPTTTAETTDTKQG